MKSLANILLRVAVSLLTMELRKSLLSFFSVSMSEFWLEERIEKNISKAVRYINTFILFN